MPELVLAADLGTSGCKVALFTLTGERVADRYVTYGTTFAEPRHQEQRPATWWLSTQRAFRDVIEGAGVAPGRIGAIALSGQSLALVPLDRRGRPLLRSIPIWSDARAERQARRFFRAMPEQDWYLRTGNGFPPHLYTLFKLLWLADERPDVFSATDRVLGSKDYINYRLTGRIATDPSYASGSGAYDIVGRRYDVDILDAAGVDERTWPEIRPSSSVLGGVLPDVARRIGVLPGTPVAVGGVDNSCMTLGARGSRAGRIFGSLGSSDWITVTSEQPVLDVTHRPYVFDHVVPGLYASAQSTFGGGASLGWIRRALSSGRRPLSFDSMMALAATSPPGAHGLVCVPVLAGGTIAEGGSGVRGALVGLDVRHTRADIARAFVEGASMALRLAFERMRHHASTDARLLVVGGGSLSRTWRQILANALRVPIVATNVNQQAATLGAAAVGWVAIEAWDDLTPVDAAHHIVDEVEPDASAMRTYEDLWVVYQRTLRQQAALSTKLASLRETE